MGQTTLMLMFITVISKVFGFIREAVMASYIGAGDLKSIYTTANTLPVVVANFVAVGIICLLYTSPSPRDRTRSRMPSSA